MKKLVFNSSKWIKAGGGVTSRSQFWEIGDLKNLRTNNDGKLLADVTWPDGSVSTSHFVDMMKDVPQEESLSDPSAEDLASPDFNAVWQAINKWDIGKGNGVDYLYAGATGTDVMTILNAVRPILREQIAQEFDQLASHRNPDNPIESGLYSKVYTNVADRVRHPEKYSGAAQGE